MVFCLNGKTLRRITHAMKRRRIANGVMKAIHCPNPMFMFIPIGSLRYFSAMAFGGVPIGVPIPPMFAAIGIASARAILPFPSAGSDFSTGVRNVSIIAAVAVLLRNIENTAVTRMNPRSTNLDCVPNGFRRDLASIRSSPLFVAAIASTNPPMKSMMIGSAKQWRIDL